VVQRSFQIDRTFLAIRTNSYAVAEWMDVLSAYEVYDEDAEPYLSIWAGERRAHSRGFHIFYREAQRTLRTHDFGAIAHALLGHLETYALRRDRSALHLDMAVIRRGGVTALVPSGFVPFLRDRGKRPERELDLPITPYVSLDLDSGRLLPYRRRLAVPADAVERLAALDPEGAGTQSDVDVPEVPDIACVFLNGDTPVRGVPSVHGVYAIAQVARNLGEFGRGGVDAISRLLDSVPVYAFTPDSAAAMLPQVVAMLDGATAMA
jgi:hypothetical protein